jgi:hypothetical protein
MREGTKMKKDEAEQDGTETVRPELSGSRFGRVSEKGGILPGFFSCGGGERTCHDMIGIPDLSGLVSSCRDVIGPMRGGWDGDDSTDGLQVVRSDVAGCQKNLVECQSLVVMV